MGEFPGRIVGLASAGQAVSPAKLGPGQVKCRGEEHSSPPIGWLSTDLVPPQMGFNGVSRSVDLLVKGCIARDIQEQPPVASSSWRKGLRCIITI